MFLLEDGGRILGIIT